jgi:hypothetical protein
MPANYFPSSQTHPTGQFQAQRLAARLGPAAPANDRLHPLHLLWTPHGLAVSQFFVIAPRPPPLLYPTGKGLIADSGHRREFLPAQAALLKFVQKHFPALHRRAHTPQYVGFEQWFRCHQFSRIRHTPSHYDTYDPTDQWRYG